jgi:hypothetical protein
VNAKNVSKSGEGKPHSGSRQQDPKGNHTERNHSHRHMKQYRRVKPRFEQKSYSQQKRYSDDILHLGSPSAFSISPLSIRFAADAVSNQLFTTVEQLM